jgi:RNA polymerase sigma factor (sigma-70 family)
MIATRPPRPRSGSEVFDSLAPGTKFGNFQDMLMAHRCLRQICMRRVPPNWAPRDWYEELQAEAVAAAWEAERDFDPTRGVPLEAFVNQRILAQALRRYRREWAFGRRSRVHFEGDDRNVATPNRSSSIDISDSLQSCLRRLPKPQRLLIEDLYWEGKTVVEVARMLALSQPAISRRKRRALDQLRRWMDLPERENNDSSED